MKRSSASERARRINLALVLIRKHDVAAGAAAELAKQCGISRRQAHRYIREARTRRDPVPVPEPKIAFTVKLSRTLICALRERARNTGVSLSELITQAVEAFLSKGRGRG